jgi:hypothetical protein
MAIIRQLHRAGFQAFAVGGCVRDLLLGLPVKDIDVATDAHPEQVEACFASAGLKTVAVGRQFGVVVVVAPGGGNVEVATFRHDGAYIDGRRPSSVAFGDAEGDVKRRDFTINALLLDPLAEQVIDHLGGLEDLSRRRLRAVGDAAARLREDRLRVLRGLRFAAQLELAIDDDTWAAIRSTALDGLSAERLMQEWSKALTGRRRGPWLRLLRTSGQLGGFCPPLAVLDAAALDELERTLDRGDPGDPLALSAALWLAPAGEAGLRWLDSQPLPAQLVKTVHWLLEHGGDAGRIMVLPVPERRRLLQHGSAALLLRSLQVIGGDSEPLRALARAHADEHAAPWRALVRAADLIALGCPQGAGLGRLLRRLEDAQLEGRFSDREGGLALARSWLADPASGDQTGATTR